MARIKDSSVEAVKQAADIVAIVEARIRLRKVGGRYTGLCPFHEERTPSFSVSPDRGTYHCFGCGVGGDAISFVEETEGVDFVGAIEWLADRFNVPLEYDESSPAADAARKRREQLYALLEQATAFYERYLWDSAAGEPVRAYLAGRGLEEPICREFRLGLSPGGNSLVRKAREKGFTQAELSAAGLLNRRSGDYFANRLMFPLADARGRVVGFQARKLREDDPLRGQVRQLARKRALPQVGDPLRAAPRACGDREAGPRTRRRGEHGRDRAAAGRARAGRRVDGNGADGAAAEGAHATDEAAVPLLRLGRGRRGGDAARDGARAAARASTSRSCRCRTVRIRRTIPRDSSRGSPTPSRIRCTGSGSRSRRSRDKSDAYLRGQEILDGIADSPERQEAWRLLNDHVGMTVQLRAAGGQTMAGSGVSPRLLDASERLELSALAGVRAHPKLGPHARPARA